MSLTSREPVAVAAVVRAVAYILVAIGLVEDADALALTVVPAVEAVLAIWTRNRVTPTSGPTKPLP